MKQITEPYLLVDSCRGIYCGQALVNNWEENFKNKEELKEDIAICKAGPDHDEYLDAWANVIDNAIIVIGRQEMTLEENDGDIWAIPDGYKWPE